jgi:hypothetical protein
MPRKILVLTKHAKEALSENFTIYLDTSIEPKKEEAIFYRNKIPQICSNGNKFMKETLMANGLVAFHFAIEMIPMVAEMCKIAKQKMGNRMKKYNLIKQYVHIMHAR